MILINLAYEFFRIGLFSFGGGYATIPFLYHLSEIYGWYTIKELSQMIGIASITPGPVGINVATYAGYKTAGIMGSLLATTSELIPSFILVIIVSKLLKKFSENFYIKALLRTLKPISCALLLAVSANLLKPQISDIKALILLALLIQLSWKSKKDPLFYIIITGIVGICIKLIGI